MDVDPNYDPSDFLLAGLPAREKKEESKIQDDLAVSESEDEIETKDEPILEKKELPSNEEDGEDIWF